MKAMPGTKPAATPSPVPSTVMVSACAPASPRRIRGAAPIADSVAWSARASAWARPVAIPADPRGDPHRRAPRHLLRAGLQQVIGPDIECGREGVQVGVHEGLRVRRWVSNADLGYLSHLTRSRHAGLYPLE